MVAFGFGMEDVLVCGLASKQMFITLNYVLCMICRVIDKVVPQILYV